MKDGGINFFRKTQKKRDSFETGHEENKEKER